MGVLDWFTNKIEKEDEFEESQRGCDMCGLNFPETSMIIAENAIYCEECNTQRKKDVSEAEFNKKQEAALQKSKFHCYDCKFNFARRKEFKIRLCPNCGSENFVEQEKPI
ncbi:hypothetical protein HQ545_06225 [Candidatus Woesearchaeota archaeon]|nr:hypothetical protein [Candidatus Woesearchaeota archaeon]